MRNSSMIDYLFSSKDDKENEESVGVSIIIELITTVIFIAFFIGGRIIPAL